MCIQKKAILCCCPCRWSVSPCKTSDWQFSLAENQMSSSPIQEKKSATSCHIECGQRGACKAQLLHAIISKIALGYIHIIYPKQFFTCQSVPHQAEAKKSEVLSFLAASKLGFQIAATEMQLLGKNSCGAGVWGISLLSSEHPYSSDHPEKRGGNVVVWWCYFCTRLHPMMGWTFQDYFMEKWSKEPGTSLIRLTPRNLYRQSIGTSKLITYLTYNKLLNIMRTHSFF